MTFRKNRGKGSKPLEAVTRRLVKTHHREDLVCGTVCGTVNCNCRDPRTAIDDCSCKFKK
jgi:hypothetical protein